MHKIAWATEPVSARQVMALPRRLMEDISSLFYTYSHTSTCILLLFKILGCHVSLLLSVPLVFVSQ